MEIVQKISAPIVEFGQTLNSFLIPCIIFAAIALIAFAKYSYKCFKVVLPLAGIVLASMVGAEIFAPVIESSLPAVVEFVNPYYLAGIVCAALVAFICIKMFKVTILIIGGCTGYVLISSLVHGGLRMIPFVSEIILNTPKDKGAILSVTISIICALVTMFLFLKCFKLIYIFATSIAAGAFSIAIPAIFIFVNTGIADMATLVAAGIGAFIGLIFAAKQFSDHRYSN